MNFLCPSCRTPLPSGQAHQNVGCTTCGVVVDLTGIDTAPGQARLWPQIDLATETLGGFKLEQTLGAGGMGAVYAGTGPDGASVAVKVLAPLLAAEPGLRERFKREAHALRALTHPGVVRILAEGEERGFCWYAMERIDGPDLRVVLKKGTLPSAEVEALARALLNALAAVHDAGLVHRDIKPGNILLSSQGPKLCDFGIARFDGQATLTESAAILGSLRYMAPEQRWGHSSPLSDLYGVGVVLHEALWGGVPGEVPTDARVPPWLRDFVNTLVSARPSDRPASARAALEWLDARKGRFRRRTLSAAAAALVIASGAWGLPRLASPTLQPHATAELDAGPAVVAAASIESPTLDAGGEAERTLTAVAVPADAGGQIVASSKPTTGAGLTGPKPPLASPSAGVSLGGTGLGTKGLPPPKPSAKKPTKKKAPDSP